MELTQSQQRKLALLEASVQSDDDALGQLLGAEGRPAPSALCASLIREEALQYRFMALYQILVFVLGLLAVILLVWASWLLVDDQAFEGIVAGAGVIVTSVGAVFLQRQRADARDAHTAAQAGLEVHSCPQL